MKTILLIEDDTVLRENTVELLELARYKLISASNGRIGVEMAQKHIPDLIICDIMMPELDGYEVLHALSTSQTTQHIPFIFLSAKTERTDVRKGMNLGADDYITKPFSEEDLVNAIESRLAKVAILEDLKKEQPLPIIEKNEPRLKTINDLKNFFDDNGTPLSYHTDDTIYKEGEHSNYIYLVNKGKIKSFKIDDQGKELIIEIFKEDDIFGYTSFIDNLPHKETAKAIENTHILGISFMEFKNILNNNPKIGLELIQLLTDNLSLIKTQLLQMAYGSVTKKTAATILKFAEKINRKPQDPINISRNDLANVAGIASETLIRTLTSFKKQGLIKIEGRNIKVLNIDGLKAMH
ncbi:response regulator [Mariniflexile ostreae]|uniref:Response regulator n=1 Tax=Mariniflexile ostreae TaxID=1520892 RepID=A0ABV5F9H4_9FLAO